MRHEMQRSRLAMRDGLAGEIGLTAIGRVGTLLGFVWAVGCDPCGPDESGAGQSGADPPDGHRDTPPL